MGNFICNSTVHVWNPRVSSPEVSLDRDSVGYQCLKSTVYPVFSQSCKSINGLEAQVTMKHHGKLGVYLGISTIGINTDARHLDHFADEYYFLNSVTGLITCNSFATNLKQHPSKMKDGDIFTVKVIRYEHVVFLVNDRPICIF